MVYRRQPGGGTVLGAQLAHSTSRSPSLEANANSNGSAANSNGSAANPNGSAANANGSAANPKSVVTLTNSLMELDFAQLQSIARDDEIEELLDAVSTRPPPRLPWHEAREMVDKIQPDVANYIKSIQGHNLDHARAFLIYCIMTRQVDTITTLEQVKQLEIRHAKHECFFTPQDDQLLLLYMRGAHVEPDDLKVLYKRHSEKNIIRRIKYLTKLKELLVEHTSSEHANSEHASMELASS